MRLRRLLFLATVMLAPGCLVVTCGTTRSVDEREGAERSSTPVAEPGRGAGAGY